MSGAAGSTGHIRLDVDDDGIATVTIDRPERKGALTFAVLRDFNATIDDVGRDPQARVVIITGTPGSFCAGTDLSDLAATPNDQRGTAAGQHTTWPLVACPKPVIAAVDGPAVGLGAEFVTQCDVRLFSERGRIAWNFVHRGLVPDTGAGTWLLPRLIGVSAALRLLYSGAFVSAGEALTLGFASAVVGPDELIDAARAEARSYLAGSPFAIERAKRLVYEGLQRSIDDHVGVSRVALQECFASDDHREGVAAFLERRAARFVGR